MLQIWLSESRTVLDIFGTIVAVCSSQTFVSVLDVIGSLLIGNDLDYLTYAVLEVNEYLSDMVAAPMLTSGLQEWREDWAPLAIKPRQNVDKNNLCD